MLWRTEPASELSFVAFFSIREIVGALMPIRSATCADVKPLLFSMLLEFPEVAPGFFCLECRAVLMIVHCFGMNTAKGLYFILHFLQSAEVPDLFLPGGVFGDCDKDPK